MESAAVFMDQMEGGALPVHSEVVTGRAKKISENRRKISSIVVWVYIIIIWKPPIYGPIYAPVMLITSAALSAKTEKNGDWRTFVTTESLTASRQHFIKSFWMQCDV